MSRLWMAAQAVEDADITLTQDGTVVEDLVPGVKELIVVDEISISYEVV